MKRNIIFLVLAALIILAAPIFVAAQTVATPVTIPIAGLDVSIVEYALAAFGVGLVYVVNFVKGLLKWSDKKAVILTIGFSILAAAVALVVKGSFTLSHFFIYSLAVMGEMTSWFKLTKAS